MIMYVPEHFAERDADRLGALIRDYSFGLLVSEVGGRPFATHLPFLYQPGHGPHGRLLGHVARANPHWRELDVDRPVLAIFQGPHAYVSPRWYGQAGVPTWNYAAVHVYGRSRLIEDHDQCRELLRELTAVHEADAADPWRMEHGGDLVERMMDGIVAFEIGIDEIQGKFKLSQNRTASDRDSVFRQLAAASDDNSRATAGLMRAPARMPVCAIVAADTVALRHRALRPNQPLEACVYPADEDPHARHFGVFRDGALVGVASLYREAPPDMEDDGRAWRLRGMVSDPAVRGKGYGGALLRACLEHARQAGGARLWCNARTTATGFYDHHGFHREGEAFELPDIGPHVLLKRVL